MKKLFYSTNALDERAKILGLSDEILMENAAIAIAKYAQKHLKKGSKILAIAGSGNNGADVIAAIRMLSGNYIVCVLLAFDNLKPLAQKQLNIAQNFGVSSISLSELEKAGISVHEWIKKFDPKCVIDGLFGSGLSRELSSEHSKLIKTLNALNALKIACDVPSGLNTQGQISDVCFRADATISMGARKLGLYSGIAKDFVGKIKCATLGINEQNFSSNASGDFALKNANNSKQNVKISSLNADAYLLEVADMKLPFRKLQNTNKGNFGHVAFFCGKFSGACELAALAASSIGAGLVSVITHEKLALDASIMQTSQITAKMNALALGMGLSNEQINALKTQELKGKKLVLDASLLRSKKVFEILDQNCIITPHPAEFCTLLNLAGLANLTTSELQNERFKYAKIWSKNFSGVLVLKGANTIIAKNGRLFIMSSGTNALAKGGSGDVLAGVIAGLLAQGYSPLCGAITGVLAHALVARNFKGASYALTPHDIIKGIKWLKNA